VVRVGRAFDNDIILSDPTVSPYHFVLRRNDRDIYELHPTGDENGIQIGRRQLTVARELSELPVEFDAGRTRVRVLDPGQPVAPTRLLNCRHGLCVFGHWAWALVLFGLLIALSATDNYLSTFEEISWDSFWRDQLTIILVAVALAVGLVAINRLTSHRWDFPASLSFVSLLLGIALFLDLLTPFVDYYFNSAIPSFTLSIAWSLLIMPLSLSWFLIRLNHGNRVASLIIIAMLLTPAAYFQVKEAIVYFDIGDQFSRKAFYTNTLIPWDYRNSETLTIDEFSQIQRRRIHTQNPEPESLQE
jgi:hypothetical protein